MGDEPSRDPAEHIYLVIQHVGRRLRRIDAELGLSPVRLSVLALLTTHRSMTPGELARLEGVRPPSMTRLVRDLVAAGLAITAPDEDDGRRLLVSATPEARNLVHRAHRAKIALVRRHLRAGSVRDRDAIEHALSILEELGAQ